jgi:hypothetical protein
MSPETEVVQIRLVRSCSDGLGRCMVSGGSEFYRDAQRSSFIVRNGDFILLLLSY